MIPFPVTKQREEVRSEKETPHPAGRAASMTLATLLWAVMVSTCLGKEGVSLYL